LVSKSLQWHWLVHGISPSTLCLYRWSHHNSPCLMPSSFPMPFNLSIYVFPFIMPSTTLQITSIYFNSNYFKYAYFYFKYYYNLTSNNKQNHPYYVILQIIIYRFTYINFMISITFTIHHAFYKTPNHFNQLNSNEHDAQHPKMHIYTSNNIIASLLKSSILPSLY